MKPTWREIKERKRETEGSKSGVLTTLVVKRRRNIKGGDEIQVEVFSSSLPTEENFYLLLGI